MLSRCGAVWGRIGATGATCRSPLICALQNDEFQMLRVCWHHRVCIIDVAIQVALLRRISAEEIHGYSRVDLDLSQRRTTSLIGALRPCRFVTWVFPCFSPKVE